MKKKIWIPIVLIVIVAAILFVPIPKGTYDDGGTREYLAATYKIVAWNKISSDGVYEKTRIYFGKDRNKSLDELWEGEAQSAEYTFLAKVVTVNDATVTVEPLERISADRVTFGIAKLEHLYVKAGDFVEVTYNGKIMETYPAQIAATAWKKVTDLRHIEYTEQWLDKQTAEKCNYNLFADIKITAIYENCFFATPVIPMPYTIKLNGTLSDDWCVGDQIICSYENTYYDAQNNRVEADFLTVDVSDWMPQPGVAYKPVIYLYPETETAVTVALTPNGELTCTYPAYNGSWQVIASPDGTLTDEKGQTYNYLYWEGDIYADYETEKGFCIEGEKTAEFLEYALSALGLTRREANEFIVYWLPLMQNNPYNVITFLTDAYTSAAPLEINPAPDTLIRVFMTYTPSETYVQLEPQELSSPSRNGFTVVEWGGTELK